MKQLNTLPIEDFLDKARVAIKGGKKDLTLSIKEAADLQNSLSVVMTRLAGELDQIAQTPQDINPISIKVDGGSF
jgi:hypothetical protein